MKKILLLILLALSFGARAQTLVRPLQGGTGVSNANTSTITLGGPLVTTGAFTATFAIPGTFTYTFPGAASTLLSTTSSISLSNLATQATNTVVGNATSGTAVPTALAVGSCSTASSALIWTTNTGFGCNTSITANTAATATTATTATDTASKTGTGSTYATSASPTFTGTVGAAAITASGTVTGGSTAPFAASASGNVASIQTSTLNTGSSLWRATNDAGNVVNIVMYGSTAATSGSRGAGAGALISNGTALVVGTSAAASVQIVTGTGLLNQAVFLDTPSANDYVTLTGRTSNGGGLIGTLTGPLTLAPTNGTTAITGTVTASAIASSGAAQSGYLCYNTSGGVITYDGGATCLISREEYKDEIGPIENALHTVMALKPYWGAYKKDSPMADHRVQAFLGARQTGAIDMRLVSVDKKGEPLGVRENIGLLVKAIQEQQTTITALQTELTNLRGRVHAMTEPPSIWQYTPAEFIIKPNVTLLQMGALQ